MIWERSHFKNIWNVLLQQPYWWINAFWDQHMGPLYRLGWHLADLLDRQRQSSVHKRLCESGFQRASNTSAIFQFDLQFLISVGLGLLDMVLGSQSAIGFLFLTVYSIHANPGLKLFLSSVLISSSMLSWLAHGPWLGETQRINLKFTVSFIRNKQTIWPSTKYHIIILTVSVQ